LQVADHALIMNSGRIVFDRQLQGARAANTWEYSLHPGAGRAAGAVPAGRV